MATMGTPCSLAPHLDGHMLDGLGRSSERREVFSGSYVVWGCSRSWDSCERLASWAGEVGCFWSRWFGGSFTFGCASEMKAFGARHAPCLQRHVCTVRPACQPPCVRSMVSCVAGAGLFVTWIRFKLVALLFVGAGEAEWVQKYLDGCNLWPLVPRNQAKLLAQMEGNQRCWPWATYFIGLLSEPEVKAPISRFGSHFRRVMAKRCLAVFHGLAWGFDGPADVAHGQRVKPHPKPKEAIGLGGLLENRTAAAPLMSSWLKAKPVTDRRGTWCFFQDPSQNSKRATMWNLAARRPLSVTGWTWREGSWRGSFASVFSLVLKLPQLD